MKKLLVCLAASLFLCGLFTGCGERIEANVQTEEKNGNKGIIGKWQNVENGYVAEFTGQGTLIFDFGRIAVADYKIEDNVIRFDYRNLEIPDNSWKFDYSEDKLVLTEINGKVRNVYKRITVQPIDRKKAVVANHQKLELGRTFPIGKPIEFGKPYTFWLFDNGFEKKYTQFSITFERLEITKRHPINPENVYISYATSVYDKASPGKKYVVIYTHVENLGPRERVPYGGGQEVKVDKGNIYGVGNLLVRNLNQPLMTKNNRDFVIDRMEKMEPGDKGGWIFWSEIPEDTLPVEFFGVLSGGWCMGGTSFHVSLPKECIKDLTSTDGEIALAR